MVAVRYAVTFNPGAQRDLRQIHDYVWEHAGELVARNYSQRLYDFCLALQQFPERGARRDDLRRGARTLGFERRATILFRVNRRARKVVILAIAHGGRNFEAEFID